MTTDVGIFALVERETACGSLEIKARLLRRNGSRGTPMAVSRFVLGNRRHVWLCDSMGGTFIGSADPITEGALMARQMDARRPRAPAIRALAIESADKVWIWQTCRDDTVGVATYLHKPAESLAAQRSIPDAIQWIQKNYATHGRARVAVGDHGPSIVTDLFDPPPASARYLWEFLSHPNAELAITVLDELAVSQRTAAVRVWTQALVGSILRLLPEAKDNLALGVIQWLRDLESSARGRMDEVANAARECIFDVRRWTLFVPANEAPIVGVGRQVRELSGRNTEREKEEKLARAALLYRGRVDEEDFEPLAPPHLGTASSVSICTTPPNWSAGPSDHGESRANACTWAAVLWRESEIAVFRVSTEGAEARIETDVVRHRELGHKRFGGGLAFWHDGASRLLIASVRPPIGTREREALKLFELRADSLHALEELAAGASEEDAIHAIVQLTARDFVIAGRFGMASALKWLHVKRAAAGWSLLVDDRTVPLPPAYSAAHLQVRQAGEETGTASCIAGCELAPGRFVVAVGCADGQVFLSTACVATTTADGAPSAAPLGSPVLVGRLAVPVGAIACRTCDAPDGTVVSSKTLRIYAGGSDGHLVAWQCNLDDMVIRSESALLWATRERESIISIQLTTLDLAEATALPVVVAVSRNGRVVLLSDEDRIRVPEPSSPHPVWFGRPRVPGQRLDRYDLDDTPFAVARLGLAPASGSAAHKHYWPVTRLVAVTAQNRLRILSLYQPKRSNLRRAAFDDLLEMWREASSLSDGVLSGNGLRYPEALRAYAPEIWRLAVRTTLPIVRADSVEESPIMSIEPESFPHSLRTLAVAARTFRAAERKLRVAEGRVEAEAFVDQLAAALHEARAHRDRRLFKDINETVLKRFGQLLIEACEGKFRDASGLFRMYIGSLRAMDRCCRLWLETDSQRHANVQISRIKHLVDGDVFRALTSRNGTSQSAERDTLRRIDVVRERVAHVHELLADSDPLVPLEALRAVNHSLLRASWLARRRGDVIEPRESVLTLLGPFGAFASRAAATAQTALLHEITRCYAISLLAAPDAAVDVALGLCKARASRAILGQVREQLCLLQSWLLDAIEDRVQREAEARNLARAIQIFSSTTAERPALEWFSRSDPGTERSRHWLDGYASCHSIAVAIDQLVADLQNDPRLAAFDALTAAGLIDAVSRDLERARAKKLAHTSRDSGPAETTSEDLFLYFETHYEFWLGSLDELRAIASVQIDDAAPQAVRPDIILASERIAAWAQKRIEILKELYARRQLHEPHRTIYESVLDRLRHTMEGLRSSAAVQRALVVGVLGHHMLESMDEQVFRLLELSHVLSPQFESSGEHAICAVRADGASNDRKARGAGAEGTVERFAISLQRQAEQAGNAPKNLRTLFSILESMDDASHGAALGDVLQDVAARAMPRLAPLDGRHDLTRHEAACLGIALQELAANHETHGDAKGTLSARSHHGGITFTFPFENEPSPGHAPRSEEAMDRWSRIMELHKTNLQRFMAPARSEASSNGTGLYLAQLAAAVVDWRIRVLPPEGDRDHRDGGKCWFQVRIEKVHGSAS